MPQRTTIGWTDYSSNPVKLLLPSGKRVSACVKVSEACRNCYAEALTARWWPQEGAKFPGFSLPLLQRGQTILNEREVHHMLHFRPKPPFRAPDGRPRVFVQDMSDLFGEWVPDELLDQLFAVFAIRQDVIWLLLTKRTARMRQYLSKHDVGLRWGLNANRRIPGTIMPDTAGGWTRNVMPNVHLGATVEDQENADARIPDLLACPAASRFLSCEPLMGKIDLEDVGWHGRISKLRGPRAAVVPQSCLTHYGIHQVIAGGESGPKHRGMHLVHLKYLADQCERHGIAFFCKQDSGLRPGRQGRIPDRLWNLKQFPDRTAIPR